MAGLVLEIILYYIILYYEYKSIWARVPLGPLGDWARVPLGPLGDLGPGPIGPIGWLGDLGPGPNGPKMNLVTFSEL